MTWHTFARTRAPRQPFKLRMDLPAEAQLVEFEKEIVQVFTERDALSTEVQVLVNVLAVLVGGPLGGEVNLANADVESPKFHLHAEQSDGRTTFKAIRKGRRA